MSPESEDVEGRADAEARRLMDLFATLARLLGYSNREIERRGGLNHATATKHFQGQGEPKLSFFLKLIDALGLDYGEFFELAYGDRQRTGATEAAQRLRRMLEGLQPGPLFGAPAAPARKKAERAPAPPDDYETLKSTLRELLGEIGLSSEAEAPKARRLRGKR